VATEAQIVALDAALAEDRGKVIVAVYEMPLAELDALVEAVQLLDAEGVEAADDRAKWPAERHLAAVVKRKEQP
jgi:hypothetical protein